MTQIFQKWAEKAVHRKPGSKFHHSYTTVYGVPVGENAWSSGKWGGHGHGKANDPQRAVKATLGWYSEAKDFDYDYKTGKGNDGSRKTCGHFTQVLIS